MNKVLAHFKRLNIDRLVRFLVVSAVILIFYTPHLTMSFRLEENTYGQIIVSNFNTDRGEEIFTNYNYNSHKKWNNMSYNQGDLNVYFIPAVTNSFRIEVNPGKTHITNVGFTAKSIDIYFGTFRVYQYTADNLSDAITESNGVTVSTTEDGLISMYADGTSGYIQLATHDYISHFAWLIIYGIIGAISWLIVLIVEKLKHNIFNRTNNAEWMLIACPCWCFFLSEMALGNFYYIALGYRLLNICLAILMYKLIYWLFRRRPASVLICNLILVLFGIISTFVTQFRSRPIAPWDFTAIGTALDVAVNYNINFSYIMVIALIMAVFLYFIMRAVPKSTTRRNRWYVAYPCMLLAVAVFFYCNGQYYLWDMNLLSKYQTDGTLLTFTGLTNQYITQQPSKPDSYDIDALEELGEQMRSDAKEDVNENKTKPVNVIQVMNETFSNLTVGGAGIEEAEGLTPYIDSLENTIKGNLYVSVRGGGTCNSEYETLTGNTTAFFNSGVYPYNMYMSRDVPSLVSYFNDLGYTTSGMHLGKSTNWNRASAYKKLQFQETYFLDNYDEDEIETLHGHPSDAADYKILEEIFESHEGNQYIFNVTYQNHGGFDNTDDLEQTVDLSAYGSYDKAENYLSLIKISDEAYKSLIAYFSEVDEPTMIIMYGDHQPSLGSASDNLFFPDAGDSDEAMMQEYITPFIIWCNYDIEEEYYEKLSANYMQSLILHTGNFEKTAYQQYLWELKDRYPVITLYGCYDSEGNFYSSVYDIADEWIENYRSLQYNNVFDKNRCEDLFWLNGYDTAKDKPENTSKTTSD